VLTTGQKVSPRAGGGCVGRGGERTTKLEFLGLLGRFDAYARGSPRDRLGRSSVQVLARRIVAGRRGVLIVSRIDPIGRRGPSGEWNAEGRHYDEMNACDTASRIFRDFNVRWGLEKAVKFRVID
jgi:hypothetical protein